MVSQATESVMNTTANLLAALIGIDSVNPSLVPGAAGEAEIARYVRNWFGECGVATVMYEATAGRPSILAKVAGSGGGRSLLLCAHLDTVGVEGMAQPFVARAPSTISCSCRSV